MLLREMTSSALAHSFKRLARCAVAGLALAGLAACGGGGGSSTPEATAPTTPTTPTPTPDIPITPSGDSTILWTITDQCDDGADIELRFFQYSGQAAQPSRSWPAPQEEGWGVFRAADPGPNGAFTLRCTSGQRVCYGGNSTSFDAEQNPYSVWGVGLRGDRQQDDSYCTTCPASGTKRQTNNLVCPLSPAAAPAAGSFYGSLAYVTTGTSWGRAAWGSGNSRSSAHNAALARCGDGCQEVLWFQNACGSLARSADDSRAGAGWGASESDAGRDAVAACHAVGGRTCRVVVGGDGRPSTFCLKGGSSPASGQASPIPARRPTSQQQPEPEPEPEPEPQRYSALYSGRVSGISSFSWAFGSGTSAAAAESDAERQCESGFRGSCVRNIRGYANACGVIAVSECTTGVCANPAAGFGINVMRREAEAQAIRNCENAARGTPDSGTCRIATGRERHTGQLSPGVQCVGTTR